MWGKMWGNSWPEWVLIVYASVTFRHAMTASVSGQNLCLGMPASMAPGYLTVLNGPLIAHDCMHPAGGLAVTPPTARTALLLPMTTIASAIPHNTVILEVTNQTTKYLEYCGRPAQSAGVQTFLPSRQ